MSSNNNLDAEVVDICRCAACGIAEVDDIKLKKCDGCDLVRYCSDECQKDHRPEHEAMCKERAAELRDEILFKQPESSNLGDCPICCLPFPLDTLKCIQYLCCSKRICNGCDHANKAQLQENVQPSCPFCRCPVPETEEEINKNLMKRVEANDPDALTYVGMEVAKSGDYYRAFKYWTKAAELGDALAHYQLSLSYANGEGVEKDEKKEIFHLEEAAIRGHRRARFNLMCCEKDNGEIERAVKHLIISASLGDDESIQALKNCYRNEIVSKDDFAAALRAHHAAVKAMKSPQREAADQCDWGSK